MKKKKRQYTLFDSMIKSRIINCNLNENYKMRKTINNVIKVKNKNKNNKKK